MEEEVLKELGQGRISKGDQNSHHHPAPLPYCILSLCFHLLYVPRVYEWFCLKKGFCDFKKKFFKKTLRIRHTDLFLPVSSQYKWQGSFIDFCEEVKDLRKVGSLLKGNFNEKYKKVFKRSYREYKWWWEGVRPKTGGMVVPTTEIQKWGTGACMLVGK